jgi:hypothetical protein
MTTKNTILKAIRKHCLNCCNSPKEIELCPVECSLKPFRFGSDPNPARTITFMKSHRADEDFLENSGHIGIDTLGEV